MERPLRILILEELRSDALLMVRELEAHGFQVTWECVHSGDGFVAALGRAPEVILANFTPPRFSVLDALRVLRERGLQVPVVVVSGPIGEELCVAAMKGGAVELVLKERLSRLGPVVAQHLEETRRRGGSGPVGPGRRLGETELDEVERLAGLGSWTWVAGSETVAWSPGLYRIVGRDPSARAELLDRAGVLAPESERRLAEAFRGSLEHHTRHELELEVRRPDGAVRWVVARGEPILGPHGKVSGVRGTIQDVTGRRAAEEETRREAERTEELSGIAGRLAQRLDLKGVLQAACEETARAMNVEAAVVSFYDPSSRTFRHGAACGLGPVSRSFVPAPKSALDRLVADPAAVVVVRDLLQESGDRNTLLVEELGLRSVAIAGIGEGPALSACLIAGTVGGTRIFTTGETALLRRLADRAAQAIGIAQLFEASQRKGQRTELVASVVQALSGAGTDVRSLFATVVRRTAELLDGPCVLALLSEESGRLEQVASHDPDETDVEMLPLDAELGGPGGAAAEVDLAAQVVQTGLPVFVAESGSGARAPSCVPEYQSQMGLSGSRSLLIVPLQAQGRVVGTIGVSREKGKERFTREDQEFLAELADRSAMAVTNARLYEEARARTEELSTLLSLATRLRKAQSLGELLPLVLGEIGGLVGADGGAVAVWEKEGGRFRYVHGVGRLKAWTGTTVGEDEGACGEVRRTGLPVVLDGSAAGPFSPEDGALPPESGPRVYVLLQSEAGLLGVLVVARRSAPDSRPFSRPEVRLLVTCCEMVGNALRRTLLFEDARRRLKFTEALRRIDMAIIGTTDARIPLQAVLEEIRSLLQVDAADVLLHDPRFHSLSWAAGIGFRTPAGQRTVLRMGEGLAGRVALEQTALRIPDLLAESGRLVRKELVAGESFVSYLGLPLVTKGQVLGVLEIFHRQPFEADAEWLETLDVIAGQASLAIDNASMSERLQRSRLDLELAYDETIEGWSRALDMRDNETEGHTVRVKEMTLRLAVAMGFPEEELIQIQRGVLLHDIGKMGVPDGILLKPGPLTEEERVTISRHPRLAYDLLSPIAYLKPALDIPYAHHEKWDGTGYPRGIKGKEIPRAARLFAVVDVWDALRSDRPYREGWPEEKVRAHLRSLSGTHFDPDVVEAFLEVCPA